MTTKQILKMYGLAITSLLIAFILTLLPLPSWTVWLRPAWVMLVVIYWVLAYPEYFSVLFAWSVGLFFDVLSGTVLGIHAFAMVLITYVVIKIHRRFRVFPWVQQMMTILMLMLAYLAIIYVIQASLGRSSQTWLFWLSALTSAVVWPWVYALLYYVNSTLP